MPQRFLNWNKPLLKVESVESLEMSKTLSVSKQSKQVNDSEMYLWIQVFLKVKPFYGINYKFSNDIFMM